MYRWLIGVLMAVLFPLYPLMGQEAARISPKEAEAAAYWNGFDFRQASLIPLEEKMENFIMDYLQLLNEIPADRAARCIGDMMHEAAADSTCFARMLEIYEIFLTDRTSPVYNEELMKAVLQKALSESVLGDIDKVRPSMTLELLSKNSVGTKATDFECTFSNGKNGRMTDIVSDYLLLFFYDPDCDHCEEAIADLSASAEIAGYIEKGKLRILAVYPDGQTEAWKSYDAIPSTWLNACDTSMKLRDEELYDLMDTPTIYLLDKRRFVLKKNILPAKLLPVLKEVLD